MFFKDEDVKVESEETKIETHHKNMGKRLKIDLKKIADPTPLLTLKEPNKRERRREIDAQKLERRRIREEQRREIEEKKREIELAKQILEQKKLEKLVPSYCLMVDHSPNQPFCFTGNARRKTPIQNHLLRN